MNKISVVAALIERQTSSNELELLIFRRAPGLHHAGEWEFPGGKIEEGECSEQALQREILEELGLEIKILSSLGEVVTDVGGVNIQLQVFCCQIVGGEIRLTDHDQWKWVRPEEVDLSTLSLPDRPFIERWKRFQRTK